MQSQKPIRTTISIERRLVKLWGSKRKNSSHNEAQYRYSIYKSAAASARGISCNSKTCRPKRRCSSRSPQEEQASETISTFSPFHHLLNPSPPLLELHLQPPTTSSPNAHTHSSPTVHPPLPNSSAIPTSRIHSSTSSISQAHSLFL